MLHRNIVPLMVAAWTGPAFAGTWSQRTTAGMTVQVYLPATPAFYASGRGLVVGLHGCTQQATVIKDRGNWEPAADRFGAVVVLPQVPNGGVVAGCWDYYGANHARTGRHEGPVLQLVDALLADRSLGIDRAQVYVAGLSSGAGEAMVLGCVAPDVFAGVGINAGPTVGTEISEIATVASSAAEGSGVCRTMAGANAGGFATQHTSVIYGTRDFVVAQGYGRVDAEVMASLYGAVTERPLDVSALPGFMPRGTGATWSDARGVRVSLIAVEGMGHAFPAGSGDGAEISFVASRGPAWPMVLIEQFTTGNRRVAGGPVPPPPDAGTPAIDAGSTSADASAGRDAATGSRADGAVAPPRTDGGTGAGRDAAADSDGGSSTKPESMTGGCSTTGGADLAAIVALALAACLAKCIRR